MPATKKRNKNNYDKNVQWKPQIRVGHEIYIDHPQHATFVSRSDEKFCSEGV